MTGFFCDVDEQGADNANFIISERSAGSGATINSIGTSRRMSLPSQGQSTIQLRGNNTIKSRVVRFRSERESTAIDMEEEMQATPPPPPPPLQTISNQNIWSRFLPFRSPKVQRRIPIVIAEHTTVEYPHRVNLSFEPSENHGQSEVSPLLDCYSTTGKSNRVSAYTARGTVSQSVDSTLDCKSDDLQRAIEISAVYLRDYERARPPTLPHNLLESSRMDYILMIHKFKYSLLWQSTIHLAMIAFLLASCYEGYTPSVALPFGLNMCAIVIFGIDIILLQELVKPTLKDDDPSRYSRAYKWTLPLSILLFLLSCEMSYILLLRQSSPRFLWSSVFKPICFFYVSDKSRQALEALRRIAPIVLNVLGIELLLILSFAAVAAHLYKQFDSFCNLSTAWLSLFQLSTTVVNPSIWMPMYEADKKSAFFFIIYVMTTTFYFHSLVLSVVFQNYMNASMDIHDRSIADREDTIRFAFQALNTTYHSDKPPVVNQVVDTESVQRTLRLLRPHYNAMKIHALIELIDPFDQRFIDYPTYRTKIRRALNTSIRSIPSDSAFAYSIEFLAGFVAVANFVYVILLTSKFQAEWFDVIFLSAGCVITFLGLLELFIRVNPCKFVTDYNPITRLNVTFDGLALMAGIVSLSGIYYKKNHALELLLTGRAIDMIRVMRFFRIFRDVVRRSEDVFPALAGPMALLLSCQHIFVYTGMAIWGGAINVGANVGSFAPRYDLNNFNSYGEGLVTMFQVLVSNDWQAIAEVYLYATRNSSPYLVYPFFVCATLISVSILLNCLTAFFVGAFVTRLDEGMIENDYHTEVLTTSQRARDFSSQSPSRSVRRTSSKHSLTEEDDVISERSTDTNTNPHVFEFDIFEREGFDKIMRTVGGGSESDGQYAKDVCDMLEVFENLAPGESRVGYLVCCQHSLNRYGNRRFQMLTSPYLTSSDLHAVVSDMHAEILTMIVQDQSLHRSFLDPNGVGDSLEISASLLRQHPTVSLFVARIDSGG